MHGKLYESLKSSFEIQNRDLNNEIGNSTPNI